MAISREASSSSSSASGHRYQVFLSFRGKDTRKGFTDHLYTGLLSAGIHTFLDEIELKRGRGISHELQKAIEESKIALVVFSKNYGESEWCLDELVRILEMMKTRGLIVLPLFYDVQPSEIKSQRGSFGQAFSILEKRKLESEEIMNKMDKWKAALNEVADLAGMVLRNEADGKSAVHLSTFTSANLVLDMGMGHPSSKFGSDMTAQAPLRLCPSAQTQSSMVLRRSNPSQLFAFCNNTWTIDTSSAAL